MYFPLILAGFAVAQIVSGHVAMTKVIRDVDGSAGLESQATVDGSNPPAEMTDMADMAEMSDTTEMNDMANNTNNEDAAPSGNDGAVPDEDSEQMSESVAESPGFPMIAAGGLVTLSLKATADKAGPFTCMIDSMVDNSGSWVNMDVTVNSINKDVTSDQTEVSLSAQIPADQSCLGNMNDTDNVCTIRCDNIATPTVIGKSLPVQLVDAEVIENIGDSAATPPSDEGISGSGTAPPETMRITSDRDRLPADRPTTRVISDGRVRPILSFDKRKIVPMDLPVQKWKIARSFIA
ncbi:BgTH12-02091 [Blumeria graminis f. sp. triticale]|uniref:Bgt-4375 n=3 Tax=Blumeria graminis TaxID=34373 RepID=A0A061HKU2_BLUGR|nr:hypothetical protein BGT96224_4375 [Blumeria graminis f. sp. tritici 96224]CAD6501845.1 BgTH12-02091 [Blumeria graminis f. sp. triticale]VDB85738.1 Bgt-4375 [Blumeria graminis f. sp. tritici]